MADSKFVYENIYSFEERKQLIAYSLKCIRQAKRMTQKEVSERIGINTQTYSTYERGRNEPPAEIIVRLSYLYDIPTDFILQKDNFLKEKNAILKQLDYFDSSIDDLRGRVLSGDSETRDKLGKFADGLEKFVDFMRDYIEIEK